MLNRKKIPYSVDKKNFNLKRKDLSNWINEYEIQAYANQKMKEDIQNLILDVYDKDKDIREHFFNKYISELSLILNEKSIPKDMDSIYKEISFDIPDKSEFKIFIENRNKLLEEKNTKNKLHRNYSNYLSDNNKNKNNLLDLNVNEYEDKKRNTNKNDYISEKKRTNSEIREFAKKRYESMSKYNTIFADNDNKKDKIRLNKINNYNNKIKKDYYKNNIIRKNKLRNNIYDKEVNFRRSNITKNLYQKDKIKNNNKDTEYNNPKNIRLFYNTNKQDEIKIISRKNKRLNEEDKLKGQIYNNTNTRYDNNNSNEFNNNSNYNLYSKGLNRNRSFNINNNSNKYHLSKDDTLKDLDIDKEVIKNELIKVLNDETNPTFEKFNDEYLEIDKKKDEIKKIKINGINYKLSGWGPKKVEVNEEIILDKDFKNNQSINKKNDNNNNTNTNSNLNHKKITIKKLIEDEEEKDSYLIQKIEKDIKTSNSCISSINIPNEALIDKEDKKNFKEILLYGGDIKKNNYYELSYYKEDKLYGIDPSYFESNLKNKSENKVNTNLNKNDNNYNYNEKKMKKLIDLFTSEKKGHYDNDNENENEKNNNKENTSNYDNKWKNRAKDVKINLNKINSNINANGSKPRIYENINNSRDYKYKIGSNNNSINYRTTNDEINKEKINYLEVNQNNENCDKNVKDEIKTYDNNNNIDNDLSISFSRPKRKRFHRVIHSEL